METISNALFWISNGLLVPVIVLLLLFLIRALILVCAFFGQFFRRREQQRALTALLEDDTRLRPALEQFCASGKAPQSHLVRTLKQLLARGDDASWRERLLADYEVEAERELGQSRILAKLGPMLGLMGTLIPMGPALVGLAAGDLASMAYNMQVAFATTVVGMLIAAIGVVILQVRQRWYARELNDLEYIAQFVRDEKA